MYVCIYSLPFNNQMDRYSIAHTHKETINTSHS